MRQKVFALLFPGQGSQYVGMGRDLYEKNAIAKHVFDQVNPALGTDLLSTMFNGPLPLLTATENAQPAILAHSMAMLEVLRTDLNFSPTSHNIKFMLGHSLGEYSAAVASGALSLVDGLRIVRHRGQAMQRACPTGQGAMAAMMPASLQFAEDIAKQVSEQTGEPCDIANINSTQQVVLSGTARAIDVATKMVAANKTVRCRVKPLEVSAPFHSRLMQPAADELEKFFTAQHISFGPLTVPLISNVDAKPVLDASLLSKLLVRQVTAPVQWLDSIKYVLDAGVTDFVEVGSGKVLSGLVKSIIKDMPAYSHVQTHTFSTMDDLTNSNLNNSS
eukprot:GILK01011157.1.p1 GENE.GILK01011157.1~~GILK01011157.1.p1  ORF type:complete len:332 (-),score=36.26 GILK01011157.1:28-1023(-)